MNITILDNRDVIINSSDNLGTQNENNASIINFSFPESLMNANKKIVFITDDGNYWDLITNNSYKITNAVSKYKNVSVYVWLVDEQNDIDFRSKIWNVSFNKNEEPDDIVPTEEEISGFDTMITQLNEGLTELQNEKTDLRREYAKVEEGLEDLNAALTEVDNIDIDASKTGSVATVTITNKEGTEKSVQIEDGTDYVITQEDYQAIANVVEQDIADEIPTKTSDLENDSGFIDNTVNNLINYTLKTSTGSLIDLEMNSSTYVITLSLKDIDGNVISTDTVDLPLESVVVGGSYDSVNKKIVLTLENGNTVDIPVGDLIAGLQTEITNNNKLASDLVDDTNSGNKFVTTSEKQIWNGQYTKPSGGIPKTDLSSAVQTSLGKADSALQEHQDITGKEDKSNKVTSIDDESTDTQYPSAKCVYDELAEKQAEIDELVEENSTLKKQIPTAHISTTSTQLTDSAEDLPIEHVKIKGATSQVQYEGRNIMPRILDDEFSAYGITVKIKDNVITIKGTTDGTNNFSHNFAFETPFVSPNENFYFHERNSATYNSIAAGARYNDYTSDAAILNPINRILQSSNPGKIANYFNIFVSATQGTVDVTLQPSYELTDSVTDFEPYVGGQASPNPAYPQIIHRVTGDCEVEVVSKNLFDNVYAQNKEVYTTHINANSPLGSVVCYPINLKPNTQYTLTVDINGYSKTGDWIAGMCFANGTIISLLQMNSMSDITTTTFTTDSTGIVYVGQRYGFTYAETGRMDLFLQTAKIQLEKGSTATAYIAHAEQNAPLSLGNIELCKIGDYQDYIYKENGNWYKHNTIKKYIFDGSENWMPVNNSENARNVGLFTTFNLQDIKYYPTNGSIIPAMCSDQYISKPNYYYGDYSRTRADFTISTFYGNIFYLQNGNFSDYTNEQVKNAMIGTILYYPLETPTTTQITDATLIAQLETLINMKTYKEVTNIDLTGEDLAPVLDCDYYQDMSTIKSRIFSYDSATQTLTITI